MTSEYSFDAQQLEKSELSLGFIPLTDCAPLVVAKELGYFERYGLDVHLSKETSWANIRDKISLGILDGAQMLASMPIAMSLGLGPMAKPMVTAFSMDLNGNAITVSNRLYQRMCEIDPEAMAAEPHSARALKSVIEHDRAKGREPLTFAMVFPYSTHNYELRYWLAAAGIDPDHDVRLAVIPPPQMVGQLEHGHIDGYCVGEPWNAQAVQQGLGRTLVTKYELWNNSPEKVLGITHEWAEQHPNTHLALIMALLEASRWLDEADNRLEAAALIARSRYVNAPEHVVRMSMMGTFQYAADELPRALPDFNVFYRYGANFPWRSHAVWFITQMVRWGQLHEAVDMHQVAEAVYRPDIYRRAAASLGMAVPSDDYKREGEHSESWSLPRSDGPLTLGADRFIDERIFDPDNPLAYLRGFEQHNLALSLDDLAALNPPRTMHERNSQPQS